MAETAPRTSGHRGRGSTRAGRGGHSSRGGRSSARTNGDASAPELSLDEQGELGQLKKQYLPQISTLKEMFPDWTDDDLVFALQEADGDLPTTIDRITEGNVSQFSDVKKKTREKSRPKIPDAAGSAANDKSGAGRGRGRGGTDAGRGGRGRTTERGRGGRGGRSASRGGAAAVVPTAATGGWDTDATKPDNTAAWDDAKPATPDLPADGSWAASVTSEVQTAATSAVPETQKSSVIPQGTKKSWASIAQPKAPPAVPKVAALPKVTEPKVEAVPEPQLSTKTDPDSLTPSSAQRVPSDFAALTPPRDKLTEDNVEQLPDASVPAATETVASTRDPGSAIGSTTPSLSNLAAQQQTPSSAKQPLGGYATTAWKAAGGLSGRSASYQRRILEQQEAVVLPGNHAVDRASVQFGSMNLSNDADAKPLDIDDDREEPETRAQPPQQSPSAPRTSLPPSAPQIPTGSEAHLGQSIPTPKPAPGLTQPGQLHHGGVPHNYNQHYSRYGSSAVTQENAIPQQKPYDSYGQHAGYSQAEQSGAYPTQATASSGLSQPAQLGGIGGSQTEYGSADTTRAQQSYYGGSYGQPGAPGLQDQNAPQRTASGFGASDSGYGSNQQAQSQSQSRFSESQNSGHTTPNPTSHISSQVPQQQHQQQQHHHMQSQHHGQQGGWGSGYGQYPYNYNNPQYSQYMSQYGNAYGGYGQQYGGGPYGGKGYGQQHHGGYGMPPQGSYEHSSSPANVGGYGSSLRGSDSGLSGGLGDYNRSGSTQGAQAQHSSSTSGLGGVGDSYGRSSSGLGHQGYGQQTSAPTDETIKAYADSKTGPSPSLGQPGRTGSALGNSSQYGGQSGFPQGQSHQQQQQQQQQQGFPSHLNQYGGSSYGLGGIGSQGSGQGHQGSGFSGYSGFSGSGYGSGYGGRGWSNYQQSGGYSQH